MKQLNVDVLSFANLPFRYVDVVGTTNLTSYIGTVVNGVTVTANTRILLTAQTSAINNGIWKNNERTVDFMTGYSPYSIVVYDVNSKYIWLCTAAATDVIDTNAVNFIKLGTTNLGDVSISAPTSGQVLGYNGTNWINTAATSLPMHYCAPTAELSYVGTYTLNMSSSATWYKVNPTTSFASNNVNYSTAPWSSPSQARLQWVYPANGKYFHMAHSFVVSINQTNTRVRFSLYQNGVQVANSVVDQTFRNSADRQMFSFHVVVNANQNDYFEIYASSNTNSTTMTVYNYNTVFMACCSYYT